MADKEAVEKARGWQALRDALHAEEERLENNPNSRPITFGISFSELKELLDAASHVLAQRWVSVEERLPPNCTVLVVSKNFSAVSTAIWSQVDDCWYQDGLMREQCAFTHWMALPEPPKAEEITNPLQKPRAKCSRCGKWHEDETQEQALTNALQCNHGAK